MKLTLFQVLLHVLLAILAGYLAASVHLLDYLGHQIGLNGLDAQVYRTIEPFLHTPFSSFEQTSLQLAPSFRPLSAALKTVPAPESDASSSIDSEKQVHRGRRLEEGAAVSSSFEVKSILYVLAAFDTEHLIPLMELLDNANDWCEGGYDVKVILDTSVHWSVAYRKYMKDRLFCYRTQSSIPLEIFVHDKKLGSRVAHAHRLHMEQHLDQYDMFIYYEDDISLTLSSLQMYLVELRKLRLLIEQSGINEKTKTEKLGSYNIGLMRFEIGHKGEKRGKDNLISWEFRDHLYVDPLSNKRSPVNDFNATYFTTGNFHQAGFVILKDQLLFMEDKCKFLSKRTLWEWVSRESASSSDLFGGQCRMQRFMPIEGFMKFWLHHFADKNFNRWGGVGIRTAESWKQDFEQGLAPIEQKNPKRKKGGGKRRSLLLGYEEHEDNAREAEEQHRILVRASRDRKDTLGYHVVDAAFFSTSPPEAHDKWGKEKEKEGEGGSLPSSSLYLTVSELQAFVRSVEGTMNSSALFQDRDELYKTQAEQMDHEHSKKGKKGKKGHHKHHHHHQEQQSETEAFELKRWTKQELLPQHTAKATLSIQERTVAFQAPLDHYPLFVSTDIAESVLVKGDEVLPFDNLFYYKKEKDRFYMVLPDEV